MSCHQLNNQGQLLIGNSTPSTAPVATSCLQTPVPRQHIHPDVSVSVTATQNFPLPMQLPVPPLKSQPAPSTNFSFGWGSRPTTMEASVKTFPSSIVCFFDIYAF